jgi:hypothetical protein
MVHGLVLTVASLLVSGDKPPALILAEEPVSPVQATTEFEAFADALEAVTPWLADVVDHARTLLGIPDTSDPNRRINELLNSSEDLRRIEWEWERIWFTDQPSSLTPARVHGDNP